MEKTQEFPVRILIREIKTRPLFIEEVFNISKTNPDNALAIGMLRGFIAGVLGDQGNIKTAAPDLATILYMYFTTAKDSQSVFPK